MGNYLPSDGPKLLTLVAIWQTGTGHKCECDHNAKQDFILMENVRHLVGVDQLKVVIMVSEVDTS